jgi:hypothetical protein
MTFNVTDAEGVGAGAGVAGGGVDGAETTGVKVATPLSLDSLFAKS